MAILCDRTVKNLVSIGKSFCLAYILDALDFAVLLAGCLQVFLEILAGMHYGHSCGATQETCVNITLVVGAYNNAALTILVSGT